MTPHQTREYVTSLYENLLRRPPAAAEFEHWVQFAESGNPPERLYYAFINSEEYRVKTRIVARWPLGHYYSPIVDPDAVSQYIERERRTAATAIAGVEVPLEEMEKFWLRSAAVLQTTPYPETKDDRYRFFFDNNIFPYGDAIGLRAMIADLRPRAVIEIGSGFSSACMLDAADEFATGTHFTFIDPSCDRLRSLLRPDDVGRVAVIEATVQDIGLDLFRSLGPGDILFIDSSHVLKTGSDVHYELFHILPALCAGVVIHFHDIQFPFEYPDRWIQDSYSWNEIYAVRAFLAYNNSFRIRFWGSCFARLRTGTVAQIAPQFLRNSGGSLWIEKVAAGS
jgi:predicted O-methyltransferase YrrM